MKYAGMVCAALLACIMLAGCEKTCTHEYQEVLTQPQSCTQTGVKTFTCVYCEDAYTQPIPADGHTYGEGAVRTEATCSQEGVMEYICSGCGESREEVLAKIDHTYGEPVVAKVSGCAEAGYTEAACTYCGDIRTEPLELLAHSFGEGTVTKEANCSEPGEVSAACTVCGATEVVETLEKNSEVHVFENQVIQASTCTTRGHGLNVCTLCGHSETCEYDYKPHDYGAEQLLSEPTCTQEGSSQATCSRCGYVRTKTISALGHQWGEAACQKPVTCTVCNYTDPSGAAHNYTLSKTRQPSDRYAGQRTYECTNCGARYNETFGLHDLNAIVAKIHAHAKRRGFAVSTSPDTSRNPYTEGWEHYANVKIHGASYLEEKVEEWVDRAAAYYAEAGGTDKYEIWVTIHYAESPTNYGDWWGKYYIKVYIKPIRLS